MGFLTSLMITGAIAFVLFVIFEIIQTMAESRLANTDDLKEALNIPEAFRDIGRIGFGKVIAVIILIVVVIAVINAVLNGLNDFINGISILSIVVTPYLTFFAARATGLLYSDIA
jgi:succinate dehydrogenase/fumarate reductase cytochrome b subunit